MRLLGVQRKSDGEIVLVTHFGQAYKLPDGLKMSDVNLVSITVPEVGESHTMLSPEEVEKIKKRKEKAAQQKKDLEEFAKDNKIGLGDMVFLLTHSTGFKKWWDEKHDGECSSCQENQASWNYIRFKGPKFLKNLIETAKKEGKK